MAELKEADNIEDEEKTIADDVVVTKYKMAGDMANRKFGSAVQLRNKATCSKMLTVNSLLNRQ